MAPPALPRPALTPEVRALFFRYDHALPLESVERSEEERDGDRRLHITFTSIRGQRVTGHLWLPSGPGPHPVVVLQHGAGGSKDHPVIAGFAARWVRDGYAIACLDAYNHGERAGLPGGPSGSSLQILPWRRCEQAVHMAVDLMRTLDYLATRPDIDRARVGFAGLSMGATMGVPFVALDARVRAAALVVGGSYLGRAWDAVDPALRDEHRFVNELIDPVHFAALVSPRPVLMVNGLRDEVVTADSARALFEAFAEPKQIIWYDGGHTDFGGAELKQVWAFLRTHV